MLAEGRFISQAAPVFESVSFIIPAHNEAKYISKTIKAITVAAQELELEFEVIVVNDDSSDETRNIAIESGAKTIDVKLRNIGAVRNAGAKSAIHPWLVFVDADTTVPKKTLEQSVNALAAGYAGGGARVVIDETQPLFWVKRLMYLGVVVVWQIAGRWAAGCYMFCQKEVFNSFGGFDENYFAAEELFFSRNVKLRGRFRLVRDPPVETSARKLHRYSTWQLMRFIFVPLTNIGKPLQSKSGLEILYDDQR